MFIFRYSFEIASTDPLVEFYMMGDNATIVDNYLSQVRNRRKKFICLNDDIKSADPDPRLFVVLKEFYDSYFPLPSPAELPEV